MGDFKEFKRVQIAELRPVSIMDIQHYKLSLTNEKVPAFMEWNISLSYEDINNGSPKIGDMIARNPKNHLDQWLIAEQYFLDNFIEN